MPDLRDLAFIKRERTEGSTPSLEHAIVANSPADAGDDVFIILPEFDNAATWGPARWHPAGQDIPAAGDECLVAFSNRREPWIVAWWPGEIDSGGGDVTSVFTRTGDVVAQTGDYSVAQITGAAPLASPVLTGDPKAPTPATADNDTSIATTAFVKAQGYLTSAPVTSVFTRTGVVVAATGDYTVAQVTGAAPLASPVLTGTPTAPTAAVDTNSTQIATTAFVLGQASATTPAMDGTAAVGTSTRYARADHVHPVDTSRAPLASPTFTGVPAGPTAAADTNTTQMATTAFVLGQAYTSVPAMNGTGAAGSSTRWARGDHVHPSDTTRAPLASPTFTGTPAAPTASPGTNTTQIATTAFVTAAVAAGGVGSLQIAYVEGTSTVNATGTTAVSVISAGAHTYDGVTKIRIEFGCSQWTASDNTAGCNFSVYDGTTATLVKTIMACNGVSGGSGPNQPGWSMSFEITPTAASHTYFVGLADAGAVTSVHARVFGFYYIRVTKVI